MGLKRLVLTLLLLLVNSVSSAIVRSLPGFDGFLPFELEAGYLSVDEFDDVQFLYYFVKSERNPREDPLLLWLTGGPGCSGLSDLLFTIGPLYFQNAEYNGSIPTLMLNPNSWTKVSNIIFLDAPVSTGFSYSLSLQGSETGDIISSHQLYTFLRKWLIDHPEFSTNPFYIGGMSYSGMTVPIVVQKIVTGNEAQSKPLINLKCTERVNVPNILESRCVLASPKPIWMKEIRRYLEEYLKNSLSDPDPEIPEFGCRTYGYLLSHYWANDENVRKALRIKKGTVKTWTRCYRLPYTKDVHSALNYHLNISLKGYRSLIYSGDHDMRIPYLGTEAWIKSLNFSITDDWRPWFVGSQVAGYTRSYSNHMTFATVKGAGHTAPEYKPKECAAMFKRWISDNPL
ncbi:hypothetical protein GIB67_034268 [Kingdonia uniflora]|uniref:Uncharacterized protein n=1 Tax=Kingdonia uniflora TaxID=39325 RepID=A0A7J7NRS4_9MAGN|nr:hypothetical protein GIB67_034268 [Kingdonia uniflora]